MALTPNGLITISGSPSGGEQPTQNAGATMVAGVIVPTAGFIGIGSGATQQNAETLGVVGAIASSTLTTQYRLLTVGANTEIVQSASINTNATGDFFVGRTSDPFDANSKALISKDSNSATYLSVSNQNTGSSAAAGLLLGSFGNQWMMEVGSSAKNSNSLTFSINFAAPSEKIYLTSSGAMGLGLTPTANMAGLSIEAGLLTLKERATPTADTNYGKIYTKTDNNLYFQDGAGVEHQVAFV